MKINTGKPCGSSNHKECPPMLACDVAESRSTGCEIIEFDTTGFERIVVLRDLRLTIPVEADIKLPSFATDIKEIRKNVHLTQCKATRIIGTDEKARRTVNLFVEGFVHKNIQFVEDCHGFVKDFIVNVPFRCFHTVELKTPASPAFASNKNSTNNELRELAPNKMEADRCNFGSQTEELFNEPIECKLDEAKINQWDIIRNFDNWGRFNKITEKMSITLDLRLTQKQLVKTITKSDY
ncbi:hypothetical protein D8M04_05915 [Oceanobacillus piezotolerans]|uniref:DUF7852 domain-containing protein n=1 Tax=Oceanobacillus piezotolerans TaxID=2448030 RepID=A0A498DQC2_9BACI|nr:hypothetical protein [Oceanobacillus piezotolerans]RLL46739.1 hypothetical protein D8M04_05915 [Oceanobacillus piezotolerans]